MYYEIENHLKAYLKNQIPNILFIISIVILLVIQNTRLLIFYLSGYLINIIVNRLLRYIIKDTRLTENGSEKYNMPSGHAQMALYSAAFIVFTLCKKNCISNMNIIIILFYFALSYSTCHISVYEKYHTLDQVILGAIIGAIIGFIFANYSS